jgi:hypothetical protein
MSVKKAIPGTFILHVPTFHHIYTHMLGTHVSFLGISTLRWSLSGEILDDPGRVGQGFDTNALRRRINIESLNNFSKMCEILNSHTCMQ